MPGHEANLGKVAIQGGVNEAIAHDSALKHVTGQAIYVDDIPEPAGILHAAPGLSARAHARIRSIDLSAVRKAPGVVLVLTAADVPGVNDVSPIGAGDDPVFAKDKVEFHGQVLFAVIAESFMEARRASRLARIEYDDLPAILDVDQALAANTQVLPEHVMKRGDADSALARAGNRAEGSMRVGGQEHFYLEGQVSLAVPQEDGDVIIHCSTQHPSEVQHNVAHVLGRSSNAVTVECRRMGGAFGGKETQGSQWAAIAALAAIRLGRPVKCRLDRDDDMVATGKRHDFRIDYQVGFDDQGRIQAIKFLQLGRCGYSADLSGAICDRAMFHADNAYYLENVRIESHRLKTNTVSNTAFRGFGGPQGIFGIEEVIDVIARRLGKDPLDVRYANLYGEAPRNMTPYHQTIEDNVLPRLMRDLEAGADYRARREDAIRHNSRHRWLKKGLALTPVKFGISFTTTFLNQAGALVHVYSDGSIHLNHGGTEMGQGLFQKVAQVVAEEFQVDLARIKITATNTAKVPNTSATAASSGSDMNGMAAQAASRKIKGRLIEFAAEHFKVEAKDVEFLPNRVRVGNQVLAFNDLVREAYLGRVSLSATGFYRTPKIHYDRATASGRPFYYFAYGAAVSEVLVDVLTGENTLTRVDILHDVGRSLNPAIDLGQIEGGFIQGVGWLTSEELWFDGAGRLATHAPSTYKIPTCSDRPEKFTIRLFENTNSEQTVHRSKAVGEPPLMLGISAFRAISDAIASLADYEMVPRLDAPATPERILMAVEELTERAGSRP